MNDYTHIAHLDDPTKPWRKVWRCVATDVYVKTHAKQRPGGLGKLVWEITSSACDVNGKALVRADGRPAILGGQDKPHRQLLQVLPDASDVEPISVRLDRELRFQVARVERAVLNEREAAAL